MKHTLVVLETPQRDGPHLTSGNDSGNICLGPGTCSGDGRWFPRALPPESQVQSSAEGLLTGAALGYFRVLQAGIHLVLGNNSPQQHWARQLSSREMKHPVGEQSPCCQVLLLFFLLTTYLQRISTKQVTFTKKKNTSLFTLCPSRKWQSNNCFRMESSRAPWVKGGFLRE